MRAGVWRYLLNGSLSVLAAAAVLGSASAQAKEPPKPKSIWERDTFSGDWNGARSALADAGIEFTLQYIGEVFNVASGGIYDRSSYEGRLEFSGDVNLEKFMGWRGASTHFSWFAIHNSGENVAENAGSISDPSNIDATPTTRLFTAWFQQDFNSLVSVRIGQLAADDEFFTSDTAGRLLNGTFGWAGILAANMTNLASGGIVRQAMACCRFHPRLQWRDRCGFSPHSALPTRLI